MSIPQIIMSPAGNHPVTELCGWLGKPVELGGRPELVQEAFELWSAANPSMGGIRDLPYKAGSRSMLWELGRKILGTDSPNYPQEIGDPFVAGTLVTMADGSEKPIENLNVGEMVVNHKNQPVRVTRVIKKNFTGDLVTIKVKGWHRPLTATEFHHGMRLPHTQYRFQYSGEERVQFGDFEVGDYILTPFGYEANENIILDLATLIPNEQYDGDYVYSGKNKLPRFVPIDAKFARLLGLYLAKGGVDVSNNSVIWSFHANETDYIQETQNAITEIFGVKSSAWKTGCVGADNRMLFDFFKAIVPGNVHTKSVPPFIFRTFRSIRMELIRGWLDGDAYKNKAVNSIIGCTSSDNLGDSMLRLATSCGLRSSSWRRFRKTRAYVPTTEVALWGTEVGDVALKTRTQKITCRETPFGLARKIQQVTRRPVVDETVYCITTEGEYTAIFNGIASYQCVSFGAKNACEYVQYAPILQGGRNKWTRVFPPFLYGCGRVFIGQNRMGWADGSTGAWQAQAVQQYGAIPIDAPSCPAYSGSIAKKWGFKPGPPSDFVPIGKEHLIQSTAAVASWEDVVAALTNGYPCTIASNVGFDMLPRSDGFHHYSTHWGHQMCIIGVDDDASDPYACILNSWGDVHGHIKDFKTGDTWPVGTLRVRKKDILAILSENDSFAYSSTDLFTTQELTEDAFNIW